MGIKDQAVRRSNLLWFRPEQLHEYPGLNSREDYGDLEQLKELIKQTGVPGIVIVFTQPGDDKIYLADGYRRHRSALMAQAEGSEIFMPAMVFQRPAGSTGMKIPMTELLALQITHNEGKPLNPNEQGKLFYRYIKHGWTHEQIAERFAKSAQHIQNLLLLYTSMLESGDLAEMVKTGKISSTLAIDALRSYTSVEDAVAAIKAGAVIAEAEGKDRVTSRHLKKAEALAIKEPEGEEADQGKDESPAAGRGDEQQQQIPKKRTPSLRKLCKEIIQTVPAKPVQGVVHLEIPQEQYDLLIELLKVERKTDG